MDFLRLPLRIFLVASAGLISIKGCATLMGFVQSMIALSLGMVGSMGALSVIGYIVTQDDHHLNNAGVTISACSSSI